MEGRILMYTFTNQFNSDDKNMEFLKATMMGPNAMRVSEELASYLNIDANMRILDLGCGCGLSTLLLAKKYGASVFAADLWISPTENYERFQSGLMIMPFRFPSTRPKACLLQTDILTCCLAWTPIIISEIQRKCSRHSFPLRKKAAILPWRFPA